MKCSCFQFSYNAQKPKVPKNESHTINEVNTKQLKKKRCTFLFQFH